MWKKVVFVGSVPLTTDCIALTFALKLNTAIAPCNTGKLSLQFLVSGSLFSVVVEHFIIYHCEFNNVFFLTAFPLMSTSKTYSTACE